MSSVIRGMFFDLDGTLCDTDRANYEAYAQAFRDEGYTFNSLDDFQSRTNGLHADEFIPILEPGISREKIQRIRELKKLHYPKLMHMVEPNSELVAFLRAMAPHHVTVLVTTAQQVSAEHVLKSAGIDGLFGHMIFGGDVKNPKPHPEAYIKALELSGLQPEEVIAFEDSDPGVASATAAGIRVIRVRGHNAN